MYEELYGLVEALEAAGVAYALCGGLAYAVHVEPRATRDIDLLAPAREVDRVVRVARESRGFLFDSGVLPLPSSGLRVRRVTKLVEGEPVPLDIVVVGPRIERVWSERQRGAWGPLPLWVVSREGLIDMKRLAARPQDVADLARLEAEAGTEAADD